MKTNIIDIHAHLWKGNYKENKVEILRAMDLFGISKVYVSGLGELVPSEDEISELNYEISKFIEETSGTIGGFCYVNPLHQNALEVLMKGIEDYTMSGMKLWVASYCDDPAVFPLVEKCILYKIPILVHSFHKAVGQLDNESIGTNVAKLAQRYPEAKIIMAHLGANCYHGIKAIRDCSNVSVDISSSLYRRDDIDYTVRQIGAERILFGTDMPGVSFIVNYGQIEEASLTPLQRELIYFKNAERILDRSGVK